VQGLSDLAARITAVGKRASSALMIDVTGQTTGDVAQSGPRLAASPYPALAMFEISDCWRRKKPASIARGPTQGINWWAYARLVYYWFDPTGSAADNTYWDHPADAQTGQTAASSSNAVGGGDRLTPVWYSLRGPRTAGSSGGRSSYAWQRALYPRYEIGQWVQCLYDQAAGVWRVIDNYEQIVRFRLTEPLSPCGHAKARVFGPDRCASSASSSQSTSCICGGSQSSGMQPKWRGSITVHDAIGVVADSLHCCSTSSSGDVQVDAGTCGYAKRFADSRHWEVLRFGRCQCGSSSSSPSSSSSSSSKSSSSSSRSQSKSRSSQSSNSISGSGSGSDEIVMGVDCDSGGITVSYGRITLRHGKLHVAHTRSETCCPKCDSDHSSHEHSHHHGLP
jgi:hypothetical protein